MNVTREERRALEGVLRYGTAKGAAAALGKSRRTIEQQLESARARLGVTTTLQAVRVVFMDKETPEPEGPRRL